MLTQFKYKLKSVPNYTITTTELKNFPFDHSDFL